MRQLGRTRKRNNATHRLCDIALRLAAREAFAKRRGCA